MDKQIQIVIQESIQVKQQILADTVFLNKVQTITNICVEAFQNGNKVLFCGNGGSAADAQHLATELSGRFYKDRKPLFAEVLHVNSSYLTATANDYSFDVVYARLIQAKGKKGDILFALSTSGKSPNVVNACKQAKTQGMTVIGMTGQTGGLVKNYTDILLNIPSINTPRIQEAHILLGHIICELVEDKLF